MTASMPTEPVSSGAQQLWQATEALLRGSPADQQAASAWLQNLLDQSQAGVAALELLRPGHPAEIQFFAANMLLSAVKRHWASYDAQLRESIDVQVRVIVEAMSTGQGAPSRLASQRIIQTLAYIATASGTDALNASITNALQLATKGNIMVSLELLAGLADSIGNLHQRQRTRTVPSIPDHLEKVFSLVTFALQGSVGGTLESEVEIAALTCLRSWLTLSASEAADLLILPGNLQATQSELFFLILREIASQEEEAANLATDVILFLMGNGIVEEDNETERTATRAIAAAIINQKQHNDVYLNNAAQIAAGIANRDLYAIAGRIPEAVELAAVALECLACEHQGAVEAAVEFFDLMNAVPVEQRHPQLGPPVYASALPCLTRQARYPLPFSSWEESEQDSESFYSFREHVLSDALETCQNLLKAYYLEHYAQAVSQAETWQDVEAALFALRQYRRRGIKGSQEDSTLKQLFDYLFSSSYLAKATHAYCLEALLCLIAANSLWIVQSSQGSLESAIGSVLQGIDNPLCRTTAASAILAICRDTQQQQALQLYEALLLALLPRLLSPAENDSRAEAAQLKVVHGLAFLLSAAQQELTAAGNSGLQLGMPLIQRAAALSKQNSEQGPSAAGEVSRLLSLFSGAIDKLELMTFDGAPKGQQPAVVLITASLSRLQEIAVSEAAERHCASALCRVLKCCVHALGASDEDLLLRIVQPLDQLLANEPSGSLRVMATAVGYMSQGWNRLPEKLGTTLCLVAEAILPQLEKQEHLDPDLAGSWFKLLSQFPTDFHGAWVAGVEQVILCHFSLAVNCLSRQEEDLIRTTLAFARAALGLETISRDETANQCMASEGERLVTVLLRAVALTCPVRMLGLMAMMLFTLFKHQRFGSAVKACFNACMQKDEVLGGALEQADRQTICSLALNANPNMSSIFVALMKDMSGIARGEMDADVLLSYQL